MIQNLELLAQLEKLGIGFRSNASRQATVYRCLKSMSRELTPRQGRKNLTSPAS
jgi:hypothetical protein